MGKENNQHRKSIKKMNIKKREKEVKIRYKSQAGYQASFVTGKSVEVGRGDKLRKSGER
jgi:hypothetical protein